MKSSFIVSGLNAALYLGLSVPVLLIGAFGLSGLMPMSRGMETARPVILMVGLLAGYGLAGGLWGRWLARQSGETHMRRMIWAGGLSFGTLTLAAMQILGQIELIFVDRGLVGGAPVHIVFAVAFTAAAFAVTAGVALGSLPAGG